MTEPNIVIDENRHTQPYLWIYEGPTGRFHVAREKLLAFDKSVYTETPVWKDGPTYAPESFINVEVLIEALGFYADPETYHACGFMFDRPTGGFDEDFDEDHGHEDYDRPMPGKKAREALTTQVEALKSHEEIQALVRDAELWRSLMSSARFKMLGSSGFDLSDPPNVKIKDDHDPDEWLHFGLEVWDKYRNGGDPQGQQGRSLLLTYATHRRKELFGKTD